MGFFNFLKTAATDVEHAAGSTLHFLSDAVIPGKQIYENTRDQIQKNTQQAVSSLPAPVQSQIQATPEYNAVRSAPNPYTAAGNFARTTSQSIARSGLSTGLSLGTKPDQAAHGAELSSLQQLKALSVDARKQAIKNNPGLKQVLDKYGIDENNVDDNKINDSISQIQNAKSPELQITNPVAKAVVGPEPVKTLEARQQGATTALEEHGLPSAVAGPLAFLGVGATEALNVVGAGGEEAGGKQLIDQLAKETTDVGIKKLLTGKVAPDVIDKVAPAIAQTKDPNIIRNILAKNVAPAEQATPAVINDIANPARVGQDVTPAAQDLHAATVPTPSVPENNPVKNVVDALRGQAAAPGQSPVTGIENLNNQQKALYSAERSSRLAQTGSAADGLTGREATFAQLGALKGQLPRVDATALVEHLKSNVSPEDVNGILDTLRTHPNLSGYEPITAQNAIVKLFDEGKLPTPNEFNILQKALGPEFTDTLKTTAIDSMTNWQKIKNFGTQVLGMPKALMASLDLSGGGRQGAVLGSRFPKEFAASQVESVKYFASDQAFKDGMAEIAGRENLPFYKKMGLNLDIPGTGAHEEQFASTLGEKIPGVGRGVAASDRAYSGGLSRLRADSADHILGNLKDAGIDPSTLSDKALKDLGTFINTASGRGNLGAWEKHAVSLGEALFSPRLWKSRLDMLNPVYYAKLDPVARKYALQSAGSFASIASTVLGLAVLAGAKVETDARSSDFLKIKVGDTRYDILGGFQQNLVLAHRELPGSIFGHKTYVGSGEKKSSVTGAVSKLDGGKFGASNRLSILSDFIQNKENPVISAAQTQIRGTDKVGNPINRATEIGKLFVPLNIQDTYTTAKNTGSLPKGLLKATIPGTVGVGVGTYGIKDIQLTPKQQATVDQLAKKGASPEQQAAYKAYYQTGKIAAGKRQNAEDAIRQALITNDTAKAKQIAATYNQEYSTSFKDWNAKYGKYSDKALTKDYNSNKINLTPASLRTRIKAIKDNPLYAK